MRCGCVSACICAYAATANVIFVLIVDVRLAKMMESHGKPRAPKTPPRLDPLSKNGKRQNSNKKNQNKTEEKKNRNRVCWKKK